MPFLNKLNYNLEEKLNIFITNLFKKLLDIFDEEK
jgi:hypothetical protein